MFFVYIGIVEVDPNPWCSSIDWYQIVININLHIITTILINLNIPQIVGIKSTLTAINREAN